MKKVFSIVIAFLLVVSTTFHGFSSQPFYMPEITTAEFGQNSDYGYVDFYLPDGKENDSELMDYSYLPDENLSSSKPSDSLQTMSVLPASYDSRNKGCITPVKQQGDSGNCWAFSMMSLLESDAILKGIDDESADYSEAHFSWFTSRSLTDNIDDSTYGDGLLAETPFKTGGNWIISAGSLARWTGAAEDADYPFNYRNLSAMGNYDESCRYDTGSGIVIESAQSLLGMSDAKEWIMQHGSATLSFYFADEYYNTASCSYFYNGTNPLNHEITVVGWNDNYSKYNFNESCRPDYNGAWLCKNSWGLNWGNKGYFWISYYDTSIEQFSGISARSVEGLYRNYTYNGAGWQSYLNHAGTCKISNVFTAKGDELITSVSVYTMLPDSEIAIYIYKNLPSGFRNPEQGSLDLKKTVVTERPGYHVIDLGAEIAVDKDSKFSVVVEYISDETIYIPIEINSANVSNSYYSNAGESYLNLPSYNVGWYDSKAYRAENVFVQAFTKCNHKTETRVTHATCVDDGVEEVWCSVCGKTERITYIPALGHEFTDWSNYVHDFKTDREIRTRECINCDEVQSEYIVYSKNTIKLEEFLEMFLGRFFEMISEIF